jgi:hypothetical protein
MDTSVAIPQIVATRPCGHCGHSITLKPGRRKRQYCSARSRVAVARARRMATADFGHHRLGACGATLAFMQSVAAAESHSEAAADARSAAPRYCA